MPTSSTVKNRINLHFREQRSRYYAEDLGNDTLLKMVEIPGGTFMMGSPEDEAEHENSEGPQHKVMLEEFFMGMYPVTQAQWQEVSDLPQVDRELDPNPSSFKGENRPVEQVSWHDAVEFCTRLSAKTEREYRLPTEGEWEYACRASPVFVAGVSRAGDAVDEGTITPFHYGETITTDLANYDGTDEQYGSYGRGPKGVRRGETTPVGSFPANAWGLYDLHGNVWEWCADHWHESYADKPDGLKANGNAPWLSDDEEANRSLRGGSWDSGPGNCRSAIRDPDRPGGRFSGCGFRVVCRAARTLA